jgi:hypothetical protein
MKKVILLLIVVFSLLGCTSTNNKLVIDTLRKQIPNDNFYFIRGLERERTLSTNIRYRGIVYSDKLKEAKSFSGIQVALEDMEELWKYEDDFVRQYENALAYPRAVAPIRENAKKIFGEDIVVYVDFPMIWDLKGQADFIEENVGKKADEIANAMAYIDVFVEDIREVDIEEYKKKLFNLHQLLYKKYNYDVDINMYLRDRKYLTYEELEKNIFYLYKNEPKVKELLKIYQDTGELSPKELGYLLDNFTKYFDSTEIPSIWFQMYRKYVKKYEEINVILPKELKNND